MNAMTRTWIQVGAASLPPGTTQGWMAMEGGSGVAAIFEAITARIGTERFMLCYHVMGEMRPRIERFSTFEFAQQRANKTLSEVKVIPRAANGLVAANGRRVS